MTNAENEMTKEIEMLETSIRHSILRHSFGDLISAFVIRSIPADTADSISYRARRRALAALWALVGMPW
jgi:hypothetical protein